MIFNFVHEIITHVICNIVATRQPYFLSSIKETYICFYMFFLHARSAIDIFISFIDVFHHVISRLFLEVIALLMTHAN